MGQCETVSQLILSYSKNENNKEKLLWDSKWRFHLRSRILISQIMPPINTI